MGIYIFWESIVTVVIDIYISVVVVGRTAAANVDGDEGGDGTN